MLVWKGGARAKLAAQQQQQQQQFPPLGAKRVGFHDGGDGRESENDGETKRARGGVAGEVDSLMGFPLPPRTSFSGKYDTAEEQAPSGETDEAAAKEGRGGGREELIPAANANAGKDEEDEDAMLDGEGDAAAASDGSSLEAEAGDTPANGSEENEAAGMEQGRTGGGGGGTDAPNVEALASAPLAPGQRRRRHVFVNLAGSRRQAVVRNLDLESIRF